MFAKLYLSKYNKTYFMYNNHVKFNNLYINDKSSLNKIL